METLMKILFLAALLTTGYLHAQSCPSETLVKKAGAKTHFSTDLKTKFSEKELIKFGCKINVSVMSKEQALTLLEAEYSEKKKKL
jgi:hypothetical protein